MTYLSSKLSSSSCALDATVFTADDTFVSTALLLSDLAVSFSDGADDGVVVVAGGVWLFKCASLAGTLDAALLASDETISVFTPFTVLTMLAQLVFAEDVVGAATVVCAGAPLLVALDGVPSAGNPPGELALVVFAALLSFGSRKDSSLFSLSASALFTSLSAGLFDTDDNSLSLTLLVVVVVAAK